MEMDESRTATNRDLFKKLRPEQIRKLTKDARCLICTHRCSDTEIKPDCAVGLKEWMDMDADADNWSKIRSVVSA